MNIEDQRKATAAMLTATAKKTKHGFKGVVKVKHPDMKPYIKTIGVERVCYDHALEDAVRLMDDCIYMNQLP